MRLVELNWISTHLKCWKTKQSRASELLGGFNELMNLNKISQTFLLLVLFLSCTTLAQQPSPAPTPQRAGRSYSSANLPKTAPAPGPTAPSPVTFTNITTQTGIT